MAYAQSAPVEVDTPLVQDDGAPGDPRITGAISGTALRNQTLGLFRAVEYDQTTCVFYDDPKITTPVAPTHGSVTVTIVNAPVAAGQPCAGTVFPQDLVSYQWTDGSKPKTVDKFSITETPNGTPAHTYEFAITLGPVISGKTVLWWFGNGVKPTGYPVKQKLTAKPSGLGSYEWQIVQSNNDVQFAGGGSTATTTTNTISIESTAGSPSSSMNDVQIAVLANSNSMQMSNIQMMTVYTPASLTKFGLDCGAYTSASDPNFSGYTCTTDYSINDQYKSSGQFDADIPVSEHFTTGPVADASNNLGQPLECDGGTCPSGDPLNVHDNDAYGGDPTSFTPNPLPPATPYGSNRIFHFSGQFNVGSGTPNKGVRVDSSIWQYYLDHADHE